MTPTTAEPSSSPTIPSKLPTSDPTMSPTTGNPTTSPTGDPTIEPTINPTLQPTIPSNAPTNQPTMEPSMSPTFSDKSVICTFNSSSSCVYVDDDATFCCSYLDARNDFMSNGQIDETSLTRDKTLESITWIRNLQIYMLIVDSILVLVVGFMFFKWVNAEDEESKIEIGRYRISLSAFGASVDVILTFCSIGLIVSNNLVSQMINLYEYNCYTKDGSKELISLQETFSQILVLDSLEAVLDICGLIGLFVNLCKPCKFKYCADIIHTVSYGIDLLMTYVNVFVFVLPSYNQFVDLYDNDDILCYNATNYDLESIQDNQQWMWYLCLIGGLLVCILIIVFIVYKYNQSVEEYDTTSTTTARNPREGGWFSSTKKNTNRQIQMSSNSGFSTTI